MSEERMKKQIRFILEIDRIKSVIRQSYISNAIRHENDAEHSWHLAVMAICLEEYFPSGRLDMLKVLKMVLIHDLVEIDAGDTYCYDEKKAQDKEKREKEAADRIFNILPRDQACEFLALWEEFELCESREARFATALDRIQPVFLNHITQGKSWIIHGIKKSQVLKRIAMIEQELPQLWGYLRWILDDSVQKGYLQDK